jgi:hypothetical protein
MSQVHKETLSAVDNALPNRAGLDIEIFGMEGIPEDIIQQHNQRVLTQYHQAEAERRVASGSTGAAGTGTAGTQPKKPKFESPSDLKRRLAEHKAKLAAEQQNGGSSGGGTPLGANLNAAAVSRTQQTSRHLYSFEQQVTTPQYPQQQHFNGGPGNPQFNFPGGYGQPLQQTTPFQPPNPAFPQQPPFSPPPFQNQTSYPAPQFPPQIMQSGAPQFQGTPLGGPPVGPPRPFGAGSPVQQFGYQQQQPPRMHTPPQSGPPPQRSSSGSLPPAPGLPQRPAFGAPHVNHFQMQQMHQGQVPGLPNQPINQPISQPGPGLVSQQSNLPLQPNVPPPITQQPPSNETSLDDLILGASKQAEETTITSATTEAPKAVEKSSDLPSEKPTNELVDEKKDKKEKSKASHLVYSDHESSPEEKMARMPRYAFTPEKAR